MKKLIFLPILMFGVVFLPVSCKKDKANPQKDLSDCLAGKWFLSSYVEKGNQAFGTEIMYGEMTFTATDDTKGTISLNVIYRNGEDDPESYPYTIADDAKSFSIPGEEAGDPDQVILVACTETTLTLTSTSDGETSVVTFGRTNTEPPLYTKAKCLKGVWNITSYNADGTEYIGNGITSLAFDFQGLALGSMAITIDEGSGPASIFGTYELNNNGSNIVISASGADYSYNLTCSPTSIVMEGTNDGFYEKFTGSR